jgi:N-hydroxyarylamine O-acetyltransferase
MSDDRIDVGLYLERIGYGGPLAATVATLNALCFAHVTRIPFNNLAVLLGDGIRLDIAALQGKLVVDGQGGYCFEQSGLIQCVLRQLGYGVTALAGRVRLEIPRPAIPPRTHMLLRVEAEGSMRLVDVGFGALSLTTSLALEPGVVQDTPQGKRRLVVEENRWFNQWLADGEWRDAYEFTLEPFHEIDQSVANWWTSTNPESRFRNRLSVALAQPGGGRKTVLDRRFTVRGAEGEVQSRDVLSRAEMLAILEEHFGLRHSGSANLAIPASPWPR